MDIVLTIIFHVVLHSAGVGLVKMGSKVTIVETPLTDLANSLTLVLIIIAEQAVLVYFSDVKIGSKVPVYLDLGEVSLSVVPHTDLVSSQVASQSASGEHKDGLTDETTMVGVLHLSWLPVHNLVVSHIHPMLLQMEEPEVVLLNVLTTDLALDLDNIRIILNHTMTGMNNNAKELTLLISSSWTVLGSTSASPPSYTNSSPSIPDPLLCRKCLPTVMDKM